MISFERVRGHTLLSRALHPAQRVIDLGANHGEFSHALSRRYGGDFTLVEANPELAHELRATTKFAVKHNAVGATSRTRTFNVATNDEASRVGALPRASRHDAALDRRVTVREIPLSHLLLPQTGVVDILKLDIEGAELDALEALTDAALASVVQLTVEFHSHPSFGFGGARRVEALLARFRTRHFTTIDFSGGTRMDVLLLNRDLLQPTTTELACWACESALAWSTYNARRAGRRLNRSLRDRHASAPA
jgi:FkbM family methyltransferase